jgi:hypothetical protein
MREHRIVLSGFGILALSVLLMLSGCATTSTPSASNIAKCQKSFQAAAAIPESRSNDKPLIQSATTCVTVKEWVAMAEKYPVAVGVDKGYPVDPSTYLATICIGRGTLPVCADAIKQGLDKYFKP